MIAVTCPITAAYQAILNIALASHKKILLSLGLIICLSGCISQGQKPPPLPTSTSTYLLDKNWSVAGKLGIRQSPESISNNAGSNNSGLITAKKSAYSLRFEWQQLGQDYTATLSGALGFGRVLVEKQADLVSLSRGKNRVQAQDADQLFYQQTGWELPVSMLRYWALGLPSPDKPYKFSKRNPTEPLSAIGGFEQAGWQVNYSKSEQISRFWLPGKMTAKHPDLKLVMVFKDWRLPENLMPEQAAQHVTETVQPLVETAQKQVQHNKPESQ